MIKKVLPLLFIFLMDVFLLPAQSTPFSRGVNLTGWFQADSVGKIRFDRYSKKDFEQIQSLSCDVIRLPINLHFMTSGAPGYRIEPLFFTYLDQAIDWAEELKIHLILDNHTFDPATSTDPGIGDILETVWLQLASRYRHRSELLYYEILNEPHGIEDETWNAIQQRIVEAIRQVDTTHTLIIGPAGWNSFYNLAAMPVYEDNKLIYTFHFYDPFLFTHQGASWSNPSLKPLSGIPFPYQAGRMPELPASLRSSWIEDAYRKYPEEGTVARVKELIDIALRFRETRRVPLFCGEFGVYIPNSDPNDRVLWYENLRKYLEENGVSWTSWDYHGGFGLYQAGSKGRFGEDLNIPLLKALGLTPPP